MRANVDPSRVTEPPNSVTLKRELISKNRLSIWEFLKVIDYG